MQLTLGQRDAAARNYERGIEILEGLPDEQRRRPRNQHLLASCYNHRGILANQGRRWDAAQRDHEQAHEILKALTRAEPENSLFRSNLAQTEHYLGALLQVSGNREKAGPYYERAQTLYAALIAEQPAVDSHQAKQADTQLNLALLYQGTHRRKQATQAYQSAEGLLRGLLERHPSEGEYALSLSALYGNWSQLLRETGAAQDALAKAERTVELSDPVLKQEPRHETARLRVYAAYLGRALAFEALNCWCAAVADWDRVVEFDMPPTPWVNRVLRAVAMARAGMHTRATAEAQTLAADPQVSADGVYDLACIWALSAARAAKDNRLKDAERQMLAERCALEAIKVLRRLRDGDYFQKPAHAILLATDLDLLSLRGRTDFKELLRRNNGSKQ